MERHLVANLCVNKLFSSPYRVIYSPPEPPKVSHHQPCPNHVGGKTFAEIGTQTLPKKKLEHHPSNGGNSAQWCVSIMILFNVS